MALRIGDRGYSIPEAEVRCRGPGISCMFLIKCMIVYHNTAFNQSSERKCIMYTHTMKNVLNLKFK